MREKDLKETGLADMAYKVDKDHEVQMARADLYKIAKYGIKLHEMLAGISEEQGLDGWVQAKITKAADYLGSVYHHLDYEMKFDEVTESKKEDVKEAAPKKMKVTDADKKAGTEAYKRMKAGDDRYVDATTKKVKETNEAEKRWKQTSMSPQEAIAKYGKENVKVKKGALRNGDDMVEVFVEAVNPMVPFGNTKRKSTSHKQSKISSTEYQKVKKRKDFNASDWKWDGDQDLYVREEMTEGMAFDEKRTDELQVVAKDMFKHALANAKKKAGK